jgi:hypothetical protein
VIAHGTIKAEQEAWGSIVYPSLQAIEGGRSSGTTPRALTQVPAGLCADLVRIARDLIHA